MADRRSAGNAIADIFMASRTQLEGWVGRILHNSADVEDVVQETYVRSYRHLIDKDIENPRAYLFATAKNLALKQNALSVNRLSDALEELDLGEVVELEDPVQQITAAREEMAWLCEAISELPVQCRKVFVLKKIYGFSHQEIAQRLGLSENTVHRHLAKGMARCTVYMYKHGYRRLAPAKAGDQKAEQRS